MTPRQWPPEAKARAEKPMAELEAFYDTIRESTPFGRKQEMPRFPPVRSAVLTAGDGDSYVIQKMAGLEGVLKKLSLQLQPVGFDEDSVYVEGMGLVSSIRAQLHMHGLVEHYSRPGQ